VLIEVVEIARSQSYTQSVFEKANMNLAANGILLTNPGFLPGMVPGGGNSEARNHGGEIHVSFLKDRLRVGLGTRDFNDFDEHFILTFSIMDLPGATYWLTR